MSLSVFMSFNVGVGVSIKAFPQTVGVVADPPQPCKRKVVHTDMCSNVVFILGSVILFP